jgi:vancomycin permeability regulator SanA
MSGDHGREDYDEVTVMKRFAVEAGVPEEDIFQDHAGFSTYESLWRAREIFGAERVVIVTQEYHLYRALHLAEQLGLEAVGVSADLRPYRGQILRNGREMLARVKAFADGILQPDAVGGEPISLAGDGRVTDG